MKDYTEEHKLWSIDAEKLAKVDADFYEFFKPDIFHLTTAPSIIHFTEERNQKIFNSLEKMRNSLDVSDICGYVDAIYQSEEEIIQSGVFSHVAILREKYPDVFIAVNEGNPICSILDPNGIIGFERGLIALKENRDFMAELTYRLYETLLPRMNALRASGADGYIGSETYCSCDLISPKTYRDIIYPAQKMFYTEIKKTGLYPFVYYCGEVLPIIEYICELGADGLLVEEPKKNYQLEISEIYRRVRGRRTVFGNLDSVDILQKGTREDVRKETIRQISVCGGGKNRFIMANGCPVSFCTPIENVREMIETTKNFIL
jgi:uroporphyrinogen-III decarboxylase